MQNVSTKFSNSFKSRNRLLDARVKLNGSVTDDLRVLDFKIEEVFGDVDDITIGLFATKELTLKLKTDVQEGFVSIGDSFEIEVRAFDYNTNTWTEYLSMGTFYLDSTPSILDKVMTVVAYDSAIFADQLFTTESIFPMSMQDFFNELNAITGYTLDSSVVIDPTYTVDFYNNTEPYTIRELIGFVAGAMGSNARINRQGALEFKKLLNSEPTVDTISVNHTYGYEQLNPVRRLSNVLISNETENFESGSGIKSETLYGFNPFISQEIADDVLTNVNGYSYVPMKVDWIVFPWLDCGDKITIEKFTGTTWINNDREWQLENEIWDGTELVSAYDTPRSFPDGDSDWQDTTTLWQETYRTWDGLDTVSSVILNNVITFSAGLTGTITNPALSAQEIEYKVDSLLERKVNNLNKNVIKKTERYYGVRINEEVGIEVIESLERARAEFNADRIRLQKGDGLGGYTDSLYFDALNDRYKFVGEVVVEAISGIDADDVEETLNKIWADASWRFTGKTTINGGAIEADTVTAVAINVGFLSAISADMGHVTAGSFDVDQNCSVGEKFTLGDPLGSRVDLQKATSGGFVVGVSGDDIMRMFTNAVWIDGHIGIRTGNTIAMVDSLYDSRDTVITFDNNSTRYGGTGSRSITSIFNYNVDLDNNDINNVDALEVDHITSNFQSYVEFDSNVRFDSYIGFYGETPVSKDSVANMPSSFASTTYNETERRMLNDVYDKVNEMIDVFQRNGMF